MNYYSTETSTSWKFRLIKEWNRIQVDLSKKEIYLFSPCFEICDAKWGHYKDGVISLSRHLLNNFNWGAVVHVLKHEVAHYIVDKAWSMRDLNPHGNAFKKACKILDVDDRRVSSIRDLLNDEKNYNNKKNITDKIKKIMSLSSSSNKNESELALQKAQELMLKYNIGCLDDNTPDNYIFRPVGPLMKKVPNYVRDLTNLISDHYFINIILCHNKEGRYYEFFGTPENLEIAEYIFCGLLNQCEKLWREHSIELKKKYGYVRGIASKACYIEGVISGYRDKLHKQKEEICHSNNALIWKGDPLMNEMYRKCYPNLIETSYARTAYGGGYNSGYNEGMKLSLNAGLRNNSSAGYNKKLLTCK